MKKKIKKKAGTLVVILMLLVSLVTIKTMLSMSAKYYSDPISYPDLDNVISMHVTDNHEKTVEIAEERFEDLLGYIGNAAPTRRESVNDHPMVDDYYTLNISAVDGEYRYFVYEDDGHVYVEMSYVGVYEVDREVVELVESLLNN